jgi:hypothetical protein
MICESLGNNCLRQLIPLKIKLRANMKYEVS